MKQLSAILTDPGSESPNATAPMERVYLELRQLADRQMKAERSDHTLTPTALVHETYLRLSQNMPDLVDETSRAQFFAAAAESMRRILIEHARKHGRRKQKFRENFAQTAESRQLVMGVNTDVIEVDEALQRLAAVHPEKAELVKLRFFGGLAIPDAAAALGISEATAKRHWNFARAWLSRDLLEHRETDSAS